MKQKYIYIYIYVYNILLYHGIYISYIAFFHQLETGKSSQKKKNY
jgi:hypothetical protein